MTEVKLVISEADYSTSEYDEASGTHSGSLGTQRALVGVATNETEALKLISQDHINIVTGNGLNPFTKPVEKINDEEYKLSGEPMTWKIISVEPNTIVNQEL